MKKKKLTLEQLDFINDVYTDIMNREASRTDITRCYYLLTQENVPEEIRAITIVDWHTEYWQPLWDAAQEEEYKRQLLLL